MPVSSEMSEYEGETEGLVESLLRSEESDTGRSCCGRARVRREKMGCVDHLVVGGEKGG